MSEEVTYYSDGAIQITNARAVLGEKTYAMANITSVTMGKRPANRTPGVVIALVGLVLAACIGMIDPDGGGWLFGLLLLVVGIVIAAVAKTKYVVRVGSASGETDALVSENQEYIQKIVNAVNEAIIKRG